MNGPARRVPAAYAVAPAVAVACLLTAFAMLDVRPLVAVLSAVTVAIAAVVTVDLVRRARRAMHGVRVVVVRAGDEVPPPA